MSAAATGGEVDSARIVRQLSSIYSKQLLDELNSQQKSNQPACLSRGKSTEPTNLCWLPAASTSRTYSLRKESPPVRKQRWSWQVTAKEACYLLEFAYTSYL